MDDDLLLLEMLAAARPEPPKGEVIISEQRPADLAVREGLPWWAWLIILIWPAAGVAGAVFGLLQRQNAGMLAASAASGLLVGGVLWWALSTSRKATRLRTLSLGSNGLIVQTGEHQQHFRLETLYWYLGSAEDDGSIDAQTFAEPLIVLLVPYAGSLKTHCCGFTPEFYDRWRIVLEGYNVPQTTREESNAVVRQMLMNSGFGIALITGLTFARAMLMQRPGWQWLEDAVPSGVAGGLTITLGWAVALLIPWLRARAGFQKDAFENRLTAAAVFWPATFMAFGGPRPLGIAITSLIALLTNFVVLRLLTGEWPKPPAKLSSPWKKPGEGHRSDSEAEKMPTQWRPANSNETAVRHRSPLASDTIGEQ